MAPLAGWFAGEARVSTRRGPPTFWPFSALSGWSGFDVNLRPPCDEDFDPSGRAVLVTGQGSGRRGALKVSSLLHWVAFVWLAALYFTFLAGELSAFLLLCAGLLFFLEHMSPRKWTSPFFRINVLAGFVVLLMVWAGVQKEF